MVSELSTQKRQDRLQKEEVQKSFREDLYLIRTMRAYVAQGVRPT